MSDEKSLIDISDLSKPATVFVEKVSNAIGILYEPTQIRRKAHAEADAAKIAALSEIEISKVQQRALNRLVFEEGRKQENIESITAKAAENISDTANPENMDEDWISHFFEKSRSVSDQEMQSLWAGLLSGEANSPGSYSKRTIELVSTLDKQDAHLFTALCSFAVRGTEWFPLVLDLENDLYKSRNINFASLNHLDSLGLVKFGGVAGYSLQHLPKTMAFTYFDEVVVVTFDNDSDNKLDIGKVLLTQAGQQLYSICGATKQEEFLNFAVEFLRKKNIEVKRIKR